MESATTVVTQSTDDWQQKEVVRPSTTPVKKSVHVAPIPPDKILTQKVAPIQNSSNMSVSIVISSEEENGFVPFNKTLKRRSANYEVKMKQSFLNFGVLFTIFRPYWGHHHLYKNNLFYKNN